MAVGDDVFLSRALTQQGIYWPLTGTDKFGAPVSGLPIQIRCRFTSESRSQRNTDGEVTTPGSHALVDRDLQVDGFLMEGVLTSETPVDVADNPAALRIDSFKKVPRFKGGKFVRSVELVP